MSGHTTLLSGGQKETGHVGGSEAGLSGRLGWEWNGGGPEAGWAGSARLDSEGLCTQERLGLSLSARGVGRGRRRGGWVGVCTSKT